MELENLRENWDDPKKTYRLVSTAFPAIDLYQDLGVPPEDWEWLHQIEGLTNARLRDERQEAPLVEEQDRISGPGASLVMAAFTHFNPFGSRFSDGTFGIYYAAELEETCVREVNYHRERFMTDTNEPPQSMAFRFIRAGLRGSHYDLSQQDWNWLRTDDYAKCRELGLQARGVVDFLLYESVRHPQNPSYAVFRPRALSNPRHFRYIEMYWDGKKIDHSSMVDLQFG
ncbi:MAG: RES family NAD+ phosphorylase [SAR324 cluster bacterium]|nr:RES family NAD+ phosphorylase [SAR324 cluster bacterium]